MPEDRLVLTLGSVWVFLLLAVEAMKTHKANPFFRYGAHHPGHIRH